MAPGGTRERLDVLCLCAAWVSAAVSVALAALVALVLSGERGGGMRGSRGSRFLHQPSFGSTPFLFLGFDLAVLSAPPEQ